MELKEFIKTALIDLVMGVEEARDNLSKAGCRSTICPIVAPIDVETLKIAMDLNGNYHQNVEFDIAVTVTDGTSSEADINGKIGIAVMGINAGVGSDIVENTSTTNASVSRIKFHVPIGLKVKSTQSGS